jgi:3'(2'), 5'-bisphosphate nucleotidase
VTVRDDDQLSCHLAEAAGRLLLDLRAQGGEPTALKAAGDRLSHEFLMAELARLRPDDAVLSEEGADDLARLAARRVWIVDPLDGTREFGEAGRRDWAVHVALWADGGLVAGAVSLPAQGKVLSTENPPVPRPVESGSGDADRGGQSASPPLRLLVSRSRPPDFVQAMAGELGAELIGMGSAGAKAAAVIMGEADAYVHSGGQYEWDSAAPVAVAQAAGLHASRINGSPLRYNQADPSVPDILICPIALAGQLLGAIGRARAVGQPGRQPGPLPADAMPAHATPAQPSDPELF